MLRTNPPMLLASRHVDSFAVELTKSIKINLPYPLQGSGVVSLFAGRNSSPAPLIAP